MPDVQSAMLIVGGYRAAEGDGGRELRMARLDCKEERAQAIRDEYGDGQERMRVSRVCEEEERRRRRMEKGKIGGGVY